MAIARIDLARRDRYNQRQQDARQDRMSSLIDEERAFWPAKEALRKAHEGLDAAVASFTAAYERHRAAVSEIARLDGQRRAAWAEMEQLKGERSLRVVYIEVTDADGSTRRVRRSFLDLARLRWEEARAALPRAHQEGQEALHERRAAAATRDAALVAYRETRQALSDLRASLTPTTEPRPVPKEMSKYSKRRMFKSILTTDLDPLMSTEAASTVILTLTVGAGPWQRVPSWRHMKRHLDRFRRRFAEAYGFSMVALWKLEFQWATRGGVPHVHFITLAPDTLAVSARGRRPVPFDRWAAETWSDILGYEEGTRARRRHLLHGAHVKTWQGPVVAPVVAAYFLKHGVYSDKAVQNVIPAKWRAAGVPPRMWGRWGLDKAEVEFALPDLATGLRLARILRRWSRAQRPLVRRATEQRAARPCKPNPCQPGRPCRMHALRPPMRTVYRPRTTHTAITVDVTTGAITATRHLRQGEEPSSGEELIEKVRYRKVTRRAEYMRFGAGFLATSDVQALLSRLSHMVATEQQQGAESKRGRRESRPLTSTDSLEEPIIA